MAPPPRTSRAGSTSSTRCPTRPVSNQLKFGFDYCWYSPIQPGNPLILGMYFTNGVTGVDSLVAPLVLLSQSPKTIVVAPNYSSFVQDTRRVSDRPTLTYGLRWEVNPPPGTTGGSKQIVTLAQPADLTQLNQSGLQLAPLGTPVYRTDYKNFAPRFGAAYRLRKDSGHETVLRGGWGMFYDLASTPFAGASWPYSHSLTMQNQAVPLTASQIVFPALNFTSSPTNRGSGLNVAGARLYFAAHL